MKSVYKTKPNCLVFSISSLINKFLSPFGERAGTKSPKTRPNSTNRTSPINTPNGKYFVNLDLISLKFIFSIITTNIKRTATAPTYTIIKIKAKNSAPNKIKRPEAPKKVNISHKTE